MVLENSLGEREYSVSEVTSGSDGAQLWNLLPILALLLLIIVTIIGHHHYYYHYHRYYISPSLENLHSLLNISVLLSHLIINAVQLPFMYGEG